MPVDPVTWGSPKPLVCSPLVESSELEQLFFLQDSVFDTQTFIGKYHHNKKK